MQNKKQNSIKIILLMVLVAVAIVSAFLLGSSIGKSSNTHSSASDSIVHSGSEETGMSDNIFNLITAFDDFADAQVQQAEVKMDFSFGSLDFDEEITVKTGAVDGKQVSHIQRGKLDIYICDGQVFVEDDNAHFSLNSSGEYDDISMRRIFAVAYEITQKGDFEVKTAGDETVYTLSLTQQQLEEILNSFQGTMDNLDVKMEKGMLQITLENGKLDEIDVICKGYAEILSAQVDGGISVEVDLSVSEQGMTVPQSVMEQVR